MTHKEVETYVLSMPNAELDYPFGEEVAVYKGPSFGNQVIAVTYKSPNVFPRQLSAKYNCVPMLLQYML